MERDSVKNWLKSLDLRKVSLGVLIGGSLGFAYYYFIGCRTGTCAITSNPLNSTGYGAVMGLVWSWPGKKKDKKS